MYTSITMLANRKACSKAYFGKLTLNYNISSSTEVGEKDDKEQKQCTHFLLLLLCSSVSVCFAEPLLLSPLLPLDFLLSLVAIALREGHASPESGSGVRAAAGCSLGAAFSLPPPNAERLLELEVVFPEVAGCCVGIGLLLHGERRQGDSI